MNQLIRFPNLGLDLYPGKSLTIFGFEIAYYAIAITIGMLAGANIAYAEAKRTNQNVEDYEDFTFFTIIAAIVGARLYYVIFEWDYYSNHLSEIFNIRQGGLAIYGGIIASVITLIVFTKIKKLNFWLMADTAVLGLVVGQIIGRWGNFFNREAFGGYTDNLFAMQIPVSVSNGVTPELLEHAVTINNEIFIQVHPTFLYESLWNLGVFILLLLYRNRKKFHGEVFSLYVLGYGVGRFFIEGLRTDQLIIKPFNLPVSQLLSLILVIASIAFISYNRIKLKKQ